MNDFETRNSGQRIDAELGTQDEFIEWVEDLAQAGKELLLWFGVGVIALLLSAAVIHLITNLKVFP